jgi:hypothetical protein
MRIKNGSNEDQMEGKCPNEEPNYLASISSHNSECREDVETKIAKVSVIFLQLKKFDRTASPISNSSG